MKVNFLFCFFLIFLLCSCIAEGSIESINNSLKQERFAIEATYYGGIIGSCDHSYYFLRNVDSVDVLSTTYCTIPVEREWLQISRIEYEELVDNLICMATFHQDMVTPGVGCSGPFYDEYFVVTDHERIRIFPSFDANCSIEEVIFDM